MGSIYTGMLDVHPGLFRRLDLQVSCLPNRLIMNYRYGLSDERATDDRQAWQCFKLALLTQ